MVIDFVSFFVTILINYQANIKNRVHFARTLIRNHQCHESNFDYESIKTSQFLIDGGFLQRDGV